VVELKCVSTIALMIVSHISQWIMVVQCWARQHNNSTNKVPCSEGKKTKKIIVGNKRNTRAGLRALSPDSDNNKDFSTCFIYYDKHTQNKDNGHELHIGHAVIRAP
jgi:hypothetical protein